MSEFRNIIHNEVKYDGKEENKKLRADLESAKKASEALQTQLEKTRANLNSLQSDFDKLNSKMKSWNPTGDTSFEQRVSQMSSAMNKYVADFKAQLRTLNLLDADNSNASVFTERIEAIRNGAETVSEALSKVKAEYAHLLEDSYKNIGASQATQVVDQISSSLANLEGMIDTLGQKITTLAENGVKVAGVANTATSNGLADVLQQIQSASVGASGEAKNAYESLTQLVKAIQEYGNIDAERLSTISRSFGSLAAIGGGSFGEKKADSIISLITRLQDISSRGDVALNVSIGGLNDLKVSGAALKNLTEFLPQLQNIDTKKLNNLSGVNLSNFENIKVSKAALSNLAEYLPTIAKVNVEKLKSLSEVNLTNLNNISVSKSSMEAIANLTSSLQMLKETKAAVVKSDANSISIGTSDAKIQAEAAKQAAAATKEAAKESKLSYQDATRAVKDYYSTLLQVSKTKNDITLADGEFRSESGKWSELAAALNRTKTAFDLFTSSSNRSRLSVEEQGNLLRLMADEAKKYALSLEQLTNKTVETAAKKQDTEAIRQQTAAYKEATNIITQYYKMMTTLSTTKNDVVLKDGTYASESGEWTSLADALNRAEQSYKSLEEVKKSLSNVQQAELLDAEAAAYERYAIATDKAAASAANANSKAANAETVKKQNEAYAEATRIIKEYYNAQQQLIAVKDKISQDDKGAYITEEANLQGLVTSLNRTAEAYAGLAEIKKNTSSSQQTELIHQETVAQEQLAIATDKAAASAAEANAKATNAEAIKKQTAVYKEATEVISTYFSLRQQALQSNSIVQTDNGVWSSTRTEMDALAQSLNEAQGKFNTLQETLSQSIMTDEQKASITEKIAAAENNLAIAEGRAAAAANDSETAAKTTAAKQYYLVLEQLEKALRNYSAAEHSLRASSRSAYAEIKKQRDTLLNYKTAVSDGAFEVNKLKTATETASISLAQNTQVIKENGNASQAFLTRIGELSAKFGSWFGVTRVIMYVIRSIRQMISASIELDDAMTQMEIVTKATTSQMNQFADNVAKAAQRVGSSISDFIDSATTYARLGYDMSESSQLAEYTAMLQNVGDIDVSDAQDAITSIVKAFDVDTNQIESVMDKLVTTGNNFPISVSEIAEGMTNASSALAAAGNSFEQSIALLTAANTTMQDASKSSTGLRTITARIRNTKTELDELGETMNEASYEELVKALTDHNVALTDANNEYRSTYDIMSDIAEQWDSMNSMEQAALAEALAGNRQQAVFSSIVSNFQEASGAMDAMSESAGTLSEAYSVYMDSTTAHINQFKAAFQDLGSDVFDSESLKVLIDTGGAIVKILDVLIEKFGVLGVALTTVGIVKFIKNFDWLIKSYLHFPECKLVYYGEEFVIMATKFNSIRYKVSKLSKRSNCLKP